jgi:hypothetical protein
MPGVGIDPQYGSRVGMDNQPLGGLRSSASRALEAAEGGILAAELEGSR